jgi:hypothetical protein
MRSYLRYYVVALMVVMPTAGRTAEGEETEDAGSAQVYFGQLLGTAFYEKKSDIVLGKVLRAAEPRPKGFTIAYELEVAGSYRGILKDGVHVIGRREGASHLRHKHLVSKGL